MHLSRRLEIRAVILPTRLSVLCKWEYFINGSSWASSAFAWHLSGGCCTSRLRSGGSREGQSKASWECKEIVAASQRRKGQWISYKLSIKSSSLLARATNIFFISDVLTLLHLLTPWTSQRKVPSYIFGFFCLCHLLFWCIIERLVLLLHMWE